MKGFIFAAGFGERLRPITDSIPKPLVPVLNIPSICWPLMLLREAGINDIICNLHYMPDDIIKFFNENGSFGFSVSFSVEERILGTGGGLKKCEAELSGGNFVVLNSDVIIDLNLRKVIDFHGKKGSPATLVLHKTAKAREIVPVGVQNGRVVDFRNFLNTGIMSDYVYTGIAALSPILFKYLSAGFSSVVYTGYVDLIRNHEIIYYGHESFWGDVGSVESFWRISMELLGRMRIFRKRMKKSLGIDIEPVHSGASVHKSAIIKNSVIGAGCDIGKNTVLENTIVLPGSRLKDAKVQNAIVFGEWIHHI